MVLVSIITLINFRFKLRKLQHTYVLLKWKAWNFNFHKHLWFLRHENISAICCVHCFSNLCIMLTFQHFFIDETKKKHVKIFTSFSWWFSGLHSRNMFVFLLLWIDFYKCLKINVTFIHIMLKPMNVEHTIIKNNK